MFLELDKKNPDSIAIVDDRGHAISYGELVAFSDEFYDVIKERTLIFILCENTAAALMGYTASLSRRIVPTMLSAGMDAELLSELIEKYQPSYLWVPSEDIEGFDYPTVFEKHAYSLLSTGFTAAEMYEDLSLLLTTSGSTGSPKFVRHNYENVESNAANIANVFELDENERGMVSLPLQFTQGLNVASSHLLAGGTALLTRANLMQPEFWTFFKEERAMSLTGVPYSYEVLEKLRFFRMDLPHFKTLNQGGGRLRDELFLKCAQYAHDTGRKFIATYGSTETTSRMAYLPAELALTKIGSIGRALPGTTINLVDDEGQEIDAANETGELVFSGANVTLGYAESRDDLTKQDERGGVYFTGDLAFRDEDGCHFIVGRKKRFVKLFGYRVGLDESERLIRSGLGIECACVGTDSKMNIFITETDKSAAVLEFVTDKTGINVSAFDVVVIDEIPKNDAGKTLYSQLNNG